MNSYKEEFPAVPFVLVVDRSGSMQENGGIELINSSLPELVATLTEIPEVEELASVGMISFASTAQVHRRIEPLHTGFDVPEFVAGGKTSYAAPLHALHALIAEDLPRLGQRGRRPIVFFITDGNPNVEAAPIWMAARESLLGEGFHLRPKLVALGCAEVERRCLESLASDPSLVEAEEGPTREALKAILRTVKGTITTLGSGGKLAHQAASGDDLLSRIIDFRDYDIGEDEVFEYGLA